MMKPSAHRFVGYGFGSEAARRRRRTRLQHRLRARNRSQTRNSDFAAQSCSPAEAGLEPYTAPGRFVVSNARLGARAEGGKGPSGRHSRHWGQAQLLVRRRLCASLASLLLHHRATVSSAQCSLKRSTCAWASTCSWTNLTLHQAGPCRCPYRRLVLSVAASGGNISMVKAVDPAAAPPRPPVGALAARPLQLLRGKLCSNSAGLADGVATGPRCSDPLGGWERPGTRPRRRSLVLERTPEWKAPRQIPHRARIPGPGNPVEAKQQSALGVAGPARAIVAIENRRIDAPIPWLLGAVNPRPSQQTRLGPSVAVCLPATRTAECRAPPASARAARWLVASALPPASASLPRLSLQDRPASTPRIRAATTEPLGTARVSALAQAAAAEDVTVPETVLTAEGVVRAAAAVQTAVRSSEVTVAAVTWPLGGGALDEVQTWTDQAGCCSTLLAAGVSGTPELSRGVNIERCRAAWEDHGRFCSRNALAC